MNKEIIFVVVLGILLFSVLGYQRWFVQQQSTSNAETVYVHSIFGCIALKDKFTPEQFTAYNDLNQKLFGYKLARCN